MPKPQKYYRQLIQTSLAGKEVTEAVLLDALKAPLRAYNTARGLFSSKKYSRSELKPLLAASRFYDFYMKLIKLLAAKPAAANSGMSNAVAAIHEAVSQNLTCDDDFKPPLSMIYHGLSYDALKPMLSDQNSWQFFCFGSYGVVSLFQMMVMLQASQPGMKEVFTKQARVLLNTHYKAELWQPSPWDTIEAFNGYTALEYAVLYRQYNMIELLLSKGMDATAMSSFDTSPISRAETKKDKRALELLLRATRNNIEHNTRVDLTHDSGQYALAVARRLLQHAYIIRQFDEVNQKEVATMLRINGIDSALGLAYPKLTIQQARNTITAGSEVRVAALPYVYYSDAVPQHMAIQLLQFQRHPLLKPMFDLWQALYKRKPNNVVLPTVYLVSHKEYVYFGTVDSDGIATIERQAVVPVINSMTASSTDGKFLEYVILHEMMHVTMRCVFGDAEPYATDDADQKQVFSTITQRVRDRAAEFLAADSTSEADRILHRRIARLFRQYKPADYHAEVIVLISEFCGWYKADEGTIGCDNAMAFFTRFYPELWAYYLDHVVHEMQSKISELTGDTEHDYVAAIKRRMARLLALKFNVFAMTSPKREAPHEQNVEHIPTARISGAGGGAGAM